MRGSTQKLTLAGREISLYLPPKALRGTPCRLLLAADGELLFEILTQLAGTLENRMAEENRGLILVGLTSQNRDADYTTGNSLTMARQRENALKRSSDRQRITATEI